MGDGNEVVHRHGWQCDAVRTAVNPHGGWKQHSHGRQRLCERVRTAVNPHGGWKQVSLDFCLRVTLGQNGR